MKLFNHEIGKGRTLIIGEAGINHQGNYDTAMKMVDVAKESGCDVIKFQKRSLPNLYHKAVLENPSDAAHSLGVYIPILEKCELTENEHIKLKKHAEDIGISYLCSPWDIPSINFLESIGVEAYKVPSALLSDIFHVEQFEKTNKPVIFSTGMHYEDELNELIPYYRHMFYGRMALLHCISSYPTANKDVNLNYMGVLRAKFGLPVGFSGHERGIPITVAAVALGAQIIERHFTLDRTLPGPDHAASLEPHGLETLVRHIRAVEEALGDKKVVNRGEYMARETLGKILTWAKDLEPNSPVSGDCFTSSSPGYGMPVYQALKFNGDTKTIKSVRSGDPVNEDDISFTESTTLHREAMK